MTYIIFILLALLAMWLIYVKQIMNCLDGISKELRNPTANYLTMSDPQIIAFLNGNGNEELYTDEGMDEYIENSKKDTKLTIDIIIQEIRHHKLKTLKNIHTELVQKKPKFLVEANKIILANIVKELNGLNKTKKELVIEGMRSNKYIKVSAV